MIDFRYHLVSLISVFLALALGIVVGTTKLNGTVLDGLRGQVNSLKNEKHTLQTDERTLQQRLRNGDRFATEVGPSVVSGMLSGESVVIVSTTGADSGVKSGLQKMLEASGATIAGRVQLTEDYTDPRRASDLQNFVDGTQPPGFQRPETDDAGQLAGALLSYVLLDRPRSSSQPSEVDISQVLSGFSGMNMLRLETTQVKPADYAVLVTGTPVKDGTATGRARALTSLASALDQQGKGVLVTGNAASAQDDGVIGQIRGDDTLVSKVSTVDNMDTAVGQVAAVLALDEQGHGHAGQYGLADNAQNAFPAMDR
ncbi:MAG TPA: copper transporter [Mycobacteriales bacterium]|nr:copper transporter [Mycobacteriales bacterium]